MPRRSRILFPGYLYHVTQRGNNRQYVFERDADYILYLKRIEEYRDKFNIDIFSYCLMGNHVHFILRPNDINGLAKMFRAVNMRYAQYFQKKTFGSGHVWQGRFFSCLLQGDHIAEAMRYVELNPVRAGIVDNAWDYSWSSARAHLGKEYKLVTLADAKEVVEIDDWKGYLSYNFDRNFIDRIRSSTKKNLVLGSNAFIEMLEMRLGRKIMPNLMGRPRKVEK